MPKSSRQFRQLSEKQDKNTQQLNAGLESLEKTNEVLSSRLEELSEILSSLSDNINESSKKENKLSASLERLYRVETQRRIDERRKSLEAEGKQTESRLKEIRKSKEKRSKALSTYTLNYELKAKRSKDQQALGLTPNDVTYLIFPDRFCNGENDNDNENMQYRVKVDRGGLKSRHGGDLAGVKSKIDYLKDLGITDTSRKHLMKVAERSLAEGETAHNLSFKPTIDSVLDAILTTDALGEDAKSTSLGCECH